VQLLRLELKGFKSFADKTTVHFSPGMTAIVGPNGSGKSNITDAIRWVLGESNVRNLRGQKAEDIIFSGTEKRRSQGAAEATLVFDNSDHTLPDNLAEVAITRRIYRTGESEFQINKRTCRLKDIHLLLADTGLGKDSMAIIGQNRVDAILNSKPEERRIIFEDVAGISRFKINKEDALRRIQATERNMERVQDLLSALTEQLTDLEAKAEKTRTYMALASEKRRYDGAMAFHNFKTAERLLTRLENEQIALNSEDTDLQVQLTELESKRQHLQLRLTDRQTQLQEWETAFTEVRESMEQLKGKKNLLQEQQKHAEQHIADLTSRIEEAKASHQAAQQQVVLLEKLLVSDSTSLEIKSVQRDEAEKAYEVALALTREKQQSIQDLQLAAANRQEEYVNAVTSTERLKADKEGIERRMAEISGEVETLVEEVTEAKRNVEALTAEFAMQKGEYDTLQNQKEDLLAKLKQAKIIVQEGHKKQQSNLRDYQKAEGRLQLLAQYQEQHEGYLESTKTVLKATGDWRNGIKGAIGDLFTAEEKYLTALEIALGGSVNHLVTTTSQVAASAVDYLKAVQGGRATFLPMEAVQGRRADTPALKESSVIGLLVDCISFDSAYANIFTYLLGRTLLVETLDDAIALQKKYRQQLRIVTLDGDQLQPGGSLTGGSIKRRKGSVLSQREEIARLEALLVDFDSMQARLTSEIAKAEEMQSAIIKQIEALDEQIKTSNLLVATADTKLHTAKERLARKERVQGELETSLTQNTFNLERLSLKQGELEARLVSLEGEDSSHVSQSALLLEIQNLQISQQEKYEAFTAIRLEVEQLAQHIRERKTQREQYEKEVINFENKMTPLATALEEAQAKLNNHIPEELTSIDKELAKKEVMANELGEKRAAAYESGKMEQQEAQRISDDMQELSKRQQLVQRRLIDMEGRLTKNRMDTENAVTMLNELGYTKDEAAHINIPGAIADWKVALLDLTEQIDALGAINPNAVFEYEEAIEKRDFLKHQQDDLMTAKGHLESVIAEMDTAMAGQLEEVIEVVKGRFQAIFEQLFGGGTAQIVLTDPDNILQSGIDLLIQPPGKRRQQLTLLSGGERALTVIALLFAFLDYRPSPFCVLDEVDAALDEANVERYSRYLHTLGHSTQFIVVSHRKKTMEAAEVLQGVTMVERGVSRLLTVAFEDVKEDM